MNEQVLTTMMSASSARAVISAPAWESRPIMTSLSTRFLGQPRLTKPTFGLAGATSGRLFRRVEQGYRIGFTRHGIPLF